MYIVETWESDELMMNVTQPSPVWKLRGLGSGKALRLVFYAQNAKGRSENTTLRIHTRSRLALHTGREGIVFLINLLILSIHQFIRGV